MGRTLLAEISDLQIIPALALSVLEEISSRTRQLRVAERKPDADAKAKDD
jgi:hypothetical protein